MRCARRLAAWCSKILAQAFARLHKTPSPTSASPTLLLRIGKRNTAAEETDTGDFCDVEFQASDGPGLDLRMSVYEIAGAGQVIQAQAEHYARASLKPQAKRNLDLTGLTPVAQDVPLPNGFAFTAGAHREIPFPNESAVRTMASALYASLTTRQYPVSKADLKEYARSRRTQGDPEWLAFYATPGAERW
jgi:hypothetical protein